MTTTTTPSPEAEALPTLPVVAHEYQWNDNPGQWFPVGRLDNLPGLMASSLITVRALTPHAPAEAAIVALRAERYEWRIRAEEAELSLEDYKSSFWKAAELRDALLAEVERLTMQVENLSAEGQLAYKVSENVGRNALQCAQDLLQKNVELRALVAEMLELSDNWPGVAYANELEARAHVTLLGDGGTL